MIFLWKYHRFLLDSGKPNVKEPVSYKAPAKILESLQINYLCDLLMKSPLTKIASYKVTMIKMAKPKQCNLKSRSIIGSIL